MFLFKYPYLFDLRCQILTKENFHNQIIMKELELKKRLL